MGREAVKARGHLSRTAVSLFRVRRAAPDQGGFGKGFYIYAINRAITIGKQT
jgi:hypothetical protein